MRSLGVWVYIVAWPGSSCFGFVAPLNEPHVAEYVSRGFAACRGILTSPDLGAAARGSALRAVTALLQAKQLRPVLVIARILELSQALLRADASLRPARCSEQGLSPD